MFLKQLIVISVTSLSIGLSMPLIAQPTDDCPNNSMRIFLSAESGEDTLARFNLQSELMPLRTLHYAQQHIDAMEARNAPALAYCILLKGGERFEPQEYTRVDFVHGSRWDDSNFSSCAQCERQNPNRNRTAFLWAYNKPLTLTSYGQGRAILSGSQQYGVFADSCRDVCGRTSPSYTSVRVQRAIVINGEWTGSGLRSLEQQTTISNIHFTDWEMGAIFLFKAHNVVIKRNIFQRIGTFFFSEEAFVLPGAEAAKEGQGPVPRWPIYAGGAISVSNSNNVIVGAAHGDGGADGNFFRDIHNQDGEALRYDLDDDGFRPTVDKLHAIYNISASNVTIQHNHIARASGPPLTIRGFSNGVTVLNNQLEQAAPSTDETQLPQHQTPYVQQAFTRVHCSPTQPRCPLNISITGNTFRSPFCWDTLREDGDRTSCSNLEAAELSGSEVSNPREEHISYYDNEFDANYSDMRVALDGGMFTVADHWHGYHLRLLTPVDDDAMPDLVGFGDKGVYVSFARDSGEFEPASFELGFFGYNAGWRTERHPRLVGDIDGDGDGDILAFGDDHVFFAERTVSGYQYHSRILNDRFGYKRSWSVAENPRVLADMDNQVAGLDVVGFGDDGVYLATWNGQTLVWNGRVLPNAFSYNKSWRAAKHLRFVRDVDGDGKADIVGIGDEGVWFAAGSGADFGTPTMQLGEFGYHGGWEIESHPRTLVDFDDDGDQDIVGFGDSGVYVAKWDASQARFVWGGKVSPAFGANEDWQTDRHLRLVHDVNVDGYADIVALGDDDALVAYGDGNAFGAPQVFAFGSFTDLRGYTLGETPRMLGNIDADPWIEAVVIGPDEVYSLSP